MAAISPDPVSFTKCLRCRKRTEDTVSKKLYQCACCKRVAYCSISCQRADWSTHKVICATHEKLDWKKARKYLRQKAKDQRREDAKRRMGEMAAKMAMNPNNQHPIPDEAMQNEMVERFIKLATNEDPVLKKSHDLSKQSTSAPDDEFLSDIHANLSKTLE